MSEYIINMGNSSYQSKSGLLCADVSQLREEIVRCRDCRWYEDGICYQPDGDGGLLCWEREPDGFCAWGERKDT